jgi:predicted Ser/Thr protein kinase
MTPEQYQKLKQIFTAAVQLDETRRTAFLDEQCAGDDELRRQVDSLLRHHRPETVIEAGAGGAGGLRPSAFHVNVASTGGSFEHAVRVEAAPEELPPGSQVASRYRIASLLGRGGMGEVYRADDLTLGQTVALKFLSRARTSDPAWLARFRDEVRIARKVTHPCVCRVYDIGEADEHAFISMEYIDGEDLASLLRRIGRLPQDKAVQVARQICAGLGAAHDQGVLHRDLKPANIMIDGRGQARITDFGIAALVSRPGQRTSIAGTPNYIAPELLTGRPPSQRSDIYSLGVVLYEMVTGRPAFSADSFEHRLAAPRPVPPTQFVEDLDPAFERVILRCLEEDPDLRPASAYAIAAALPGGDPLAAALALGLTPSPDTVAGAEGARVRFSGAVAWFAAALVGLLAVVLLAEKTFFLCRTGLNRAPAVLEHKAREVIAAIEQTPPERGGSYRFRIEPLVADGADVRVPSGKVLGQHVSAGRARTIFEYRQGQRWIAPPGPLALPAQFDIEWPEAGSRLVQLDVDGRLITYTSLPAPKAVPGQLPPKPDWSAALARTGLSEGELTPVIPAKRPPMYADSVAAWEGTNPDAGGGSVRVDTAAIGSQVTWFHVSEPGLTAGTKTGISGLAAMVRYILFFVLLAGAGALAWRNVRSGRSDRRGAWRLAAFIFCLQGLYCLVRSRHSSDVVAEAAVIVSALRTMVFAGAVMWVFYIGLEPQVRRLWPQSIISWSRVLMGRFRDPLVGRDLLIGVAAGIGIVLLRQVNVLLAQYSGWGEVGLLMPDGGTDLGAMVGIGYAAEVVSRALLIAIWIGLGLMLLMLLLRLVVGNAWLASPAFVLAGTAVLTLGSYSVQSLPWLTNGLALVVLTWVLSRVGVFAAVVTFAVCVLLTSLPLTLDVNAWYCGLTGLALCILGVLLGLGLYVARAPGPAGQSVPID